MCSIIRFARAVLFVVHMRPVATHAIANQKNSGELVRKKIYSFIRVLLVLQLKFSVKRATGWAGNNWSCVILWL